MPDDTGGPASGSGTAGSGTAEAGGAEAGRAEGADAGTNGAGAAEAVRVCDWFDVDGLTISNDAFGVTADPARGGTITILDKRIGPAGRPVLSEQGNDLVLQEEYEQHPRWGEGPWHLSPKGPGVGSVSVAATVQAQRSPVGSRLVATYSLGDLSVTAETIVWDGAERVEFRTHVSGSIGRDRLLRVRFPAEVHGGLPVYQTATAVVGRPFGVPEADVAEHWWTLDNPAHHWFGIGSVAQIALTAPNGATSAAARQAIGVAEVVTPNALPTDQRSLVKDLVVALAGAGVTATTSRAAGTRYGSIDLDSNLPDFRIALGGPEGNSFTAEVLAAADPGVAKRLAALVADGGTARLWVPAVRSRAEAFGPDADLRGPRDLPVLIVAPSDPAELAQAMTRLCADLRDGSLIAPVELAPDAASGGTEAGQFKWPHDLLGEGAVALFNRGTLGCAVTPDGTLWMSLFRACGGWPSGVWIDGDRQTVPDGSSFAWQHWSHTFRYALASTRAGGGWREAGFSAAAEDYNHELVAAAADRTATAAGAGFWIAGAPNITLSALKPVGNPLAAGRPGTPRAERREVTVRLRETDGRAATAQLGMAGGIEAAWRTDLLEETEGAALTVADGTASVALAPFATATVVVRPAASAGAADAGAADAGAGASAAPPEPVQPLYARYWLHGKGPAPAGNVPVAVHFTPTRITLNDDAWDGRTTLTVACGPEPASGVLDLIVVGELIAEVDGAPVGGSAGGGPLRYDLPANGFASWDIAVRPAAGTADGRYFVAARISDALGQVLEDTLLVTVGEAGPADAGLEPEELFFRMQSDVQALAGEASIEVLTPKLRLTPGESGQLTVKVASRLGSQLRGEVQLISPIGTWQTTAPWTQAVEVAPGGETAVSFGVTVPATAAPGWESWLLVKLMYFGRVRYSPAISLTVAPLARQQLRRRTGRSCPVRCRGVVVDACPRVAGDGAVAHADDVVAAPGDDRVVGGDDQGGAVLCVEGQQQVDDLGAGGRVEVPGGLVGQQQAGLHDQGAGDRDALLLAAR
jgi:hypothetical protein